MMEIEAQKMKWLVQGHLGGLAEPVIKKKKNHVLQISKLYVKQKTLKPLFLFLCLSINRYSTTGIL